MANNPLPFSYIKITNGSSTLVAPTNDISVPGATRGIWVAENGGKGIVEPGASNSEAKGRSFANGFVLGQRTTFSGKVFNFSFIVSAPFKENLDLINNLISSARVQISSDWSSTVYTAQFQRDGYSCEWNSQTRTFEVSLIFAAEEAF